MIYFSSDIHWGHTNICKYSNRPFQSLDEMHKDVIDAFKILTPSDELIYLGDFWGHSVKDVADFFNHLKCKKIIFIRGNHDKWADKYVEQCKLFNETPKFDQLFDIYQFNYKKTVFVCCHYLMLCWNHQNSGAIQIAGHSHGNANHHNTNCRRIDVGYDSIGKWLISIDEIMDIMKDKPIPSNNYSAQI